MFVCGLSSCQDIGFVFILAAPRLTVNDVLGDLLTVKNAPWFVQHNTAEDADNELEVLREFASTVY